MSPTLANYARIFVTPTMPNTIIEWIYFKEWRDSTKVGERIKISKGPGRRRKNKESKKY